MAEQVIEAVQTRLRAPALAGQALPRWDGDGETGSDAADEKAARGKAEEAEAQAGVAALSDWLRGGRDGSGPEAGSMFGAGSGEGRRAAFNSRAVTEGELVTGTSFALTAEASGGAGGLVSLWGCGAVSRFDGREGDLSLDGEVVSAMLGCGLGP